MTEMDLIAPPQEIVVSFALEPAYNVLASLYMLNSEMSGHSAWVERTASTLSMEQLKHNELFSSAAGSYLQGRSWESFPAWIDDLASRDSVAMRDHELDITLRKAAKLLGGELPTRETLLNDRSAYRSLIERIFEAKGEPCDCASFEAQHDQLQDPAGRKEQIVAHLRAMWDGLMAEEWARNLPVLQSCIDAFASLDYSTKSAAEIISLVADRELPQAWEDFVPEIQEIIFIPSPHIGPYLLLMEYDHQRARIVFGARIPKGTTVLSPALSRSELVMRLSALADDTRLSILELVAQRGELRAQEIMNELDLSQSAASRHLRQLGATGYLAVRRCEGGKCYLLNRDRIADTFAALQRFLR